MPVGTRKTSGDRLSIAAADFNRWQEAADRVRRGKTFDPRALDLGGFRYATAKVRNDAEETLEAFDVVGLGEPLIAPVANEEEFLRQATFKAVLPVAGTHENKFGILLEPLVEKALGEVLLVGVVQTRLTGANVGFADITDGVPILTSSDGGSARVLWAEAGSAERWAIVRLGAGGAGAVFVSVSSPTVTAGTQPGHIEVYDPADDSWAQNAEEIRVKQANGFVLATGKYLMAVGIGTNASGVPVYLTTNQTGKDGTQTICDNVGTKTMTIENGVIKSIV